MRKLIMAKPATKSCSDHSFHVDHNRSQDRWDVVDQEGRVIGHSHDQREAIDLAIREAQQSHSRGGDVVVCVEQVDGHYSLAWSSH
jgi:hypothetical protein